MNGTPPLLGVVAGTKATDALLCHSLEKAGFRLKIVHYKIPFRSWVPWVLKRIRERGLGVFAGHLFLAAWLRIERFMESMQHRSPWLDQLAEAPSWQTVRTERRLSLKEQAVIEYVKDADAILILDSFRFSHRFFRALRQPCFQIVWGDVPGYLGDSAGYWAYLRSDPVAVTVISRRMQFNVLNVIRRIPVRVNGAETLRTVKIKQAVALDAALAEILKKALKEPLHVERPKRTECRYFYAPTLWLHLRRPKRIVSFPSYAFRSQQCTISGAGMHL